MNLQISNDLIQSFKLDVNLFKSSKVIMKWAHIVSETLHGFLELLCVGFYMICAFFVGTMNLIIFPYLLYAGNVYCRLFCVLYLTYLFYDRNTGLTGGRGVGVSWIRSLFIWKYCLSYFPIDLVKTVELSPDRNYLVCIFPHGILSYGAAMNFGSSHSKWSTLFPGIRSKLTTLSLNTLLPLSRELVLGCGISSASERSIKTLLKQSNEPFDKSNSDGYTSNAVGLVVGGARETFYAYPDTYKCLIKKRRGFVRIAFETGVPLVPALSFGENNVYKMIDVKPGFWRRIIEKPCIQYANRVPALYSGRGLFQQNFGLLPRRHPITTVIGAPVELKETLNPSDDEIEEAFELFSLRLKELFEAHKSKYIEHSEHIHLEIV